MSEQLLPHVAAVSKALDLQIELLQVYAPPLTAFVPLDYRLPPQDFPTSPVGLALREKAESYLQEKLSQLLATGVKDVSCTVIEGDPAGRIIETAQNTQNNLVAMCTHGLPLGRQPLGAAKCYRAGSDSLRGPCFGDSREYEYAIPA